MKKTAMTLALLLVFLAGCATQTQSPAPSISFTAESFPRLDGSTANIPLAQELVMLFLGLDEYQAEDFVEFHTTARAYENLANGETDLLLVYEASDETKEQLEAMGAGFEYVPIGRDALVFIVNENNPVQSLSAQQIVDIYAGHVTNWGEVGGEDIKIAAFQRNPTSGSQALMDQLVMQGTPMMEAPREFTPGAMGGLIDGLAEYDNSSAAIGYSVFYFASTMYTRPGLRFVAVDGIVPSNETIASGEYPFTNDFYAVFRADEPENSAARQLAQWLGSGEGQALVERSGYVPHGN